MGTLSHSLTSLVDKTALEVLRVGEQGLQVVMGSTALTTTGSTSLTLSDASRVNTSDVIEWGDELVLVTAKTSDAVPVLTVSRGYFSTTAEAHAENDVGHVNPLFPRIKIQEAIKSSFGRIEALGVPVVATSTLNRETGLAYVQLPTDCREVYEVLYHGSDGRLWQLPQWRDHYDLPTAKFPTGNVLNVGYMVSDDDDLEVKYRSAYRWSNHPTAPVGSDTIDIPEGCEDLPVLYAAARLVSGREISRAELDRSEEWGRTEQFERGTTGALVRARWQEFYRALDEARRLNPVPRNVRYVRQSII